MKKRKENVKLILVINPTMLSARNKIVFNPISSKMSTFQHVIDKNHC